MPIRKVPYCSKIAGKKNKRSKKEITSFLDPKLTGEQEHEKGGAVDGSMDAAG